MKLISVAEGSSAMGTGPGHGKPLSFRIGQSQSDVNIFLASASQPLMLKEEMGIKFMKRRDHVVASESEIPIEKSGR